jgi:hypothetical protein
MTTAQITNFYNQTVVQVASIWPVDDGWTTVTAWARKYAVGMANDVGSAELYHPAGNVLMPGTTTIQHLLPLDIVGQYVRILRHTPTGAGAVYTDPTSNKKFKPVWWGKVVSREWKPNPEETGLDVVYVCAGILSVLDQIVPFSHKEVGQGGAPCDITLPIAFNERGGKKSTNRSHTTQPVGGNQVYVFDRASVVDRWTARQVLDYLFALIRETNPNGPKWAVNDPNGCLNYIDKWDLSGMSVLEKFNGLLIVV